MQNFYQLRLPKPMDPGKQSSFT